jgi:fibronectin type 3 domain-containing protein
VAGPGFSLSGNSFPLILSAGQAATLNVVFDPSSAGPATGTLTIVSTSLSNPAQIVNLSGTGTSATYQVSLTWQAPTSTDPIAGYNIYRSSNGGVNYQGMNTSLVAQTAFVDSSVQAGQTYEYLVESVDAAGNVSSPSNLATVAIP